MTEILICLCHVYSLEVVMPVFTVTTTKLSELKSQHFLDHQRVFRASIL
jgi:hypothetical protein